jgi:hypothetical protein
MKQNQYRRRENLCIIGLTENEENCFDILKSLCMAMSITLEKSDVVACHRIGPEERGKPRPLIARFASRDLKVQILMRKKTLERQHKLC